MTRPSALRPREGEQPGTPFEQFSAGAVLAPMQFTLDAGVTIEYAALLGADLNWYQRSARASGWPAPATTPALFLLALLYRTFPPVQGLVLTHQAFDFVSAWITGTSITGRGSITDAAERRGRQYVSWEAEFADDATGRLLTRARNTFVLPQSDRQATTAEMRLPGPAPAGGVIVTPVEADIVGRDAQQPGATIECRRPLAMSQELFDWYGRLNGDLDVVHYDAPYAGALGYHAPIAHGLMIAGYLSEMLCQIWGMNWLEGGGISLKWTAPVYSDDLVRPFAQITRIEESPNGRMLHAAVRCETGDATVVLSGEARAPLV